MMTRHEAKTLIVTVLGEIVPTANLGTLCGRAHLRDDLGLDSIGTRNFVLAVQRRTGLDIPEAEYGRLATLDDAVAYLTR